MRTRGAIGAGLVISAVMLAAAPSYARQSSSTAPVIAVGDAYVKATLADDVKAIGALYTEDAIEMPPDHPSVKGRAAIEKYYTDEIAKMKKEGGKLDAFKLTHVETIVHGDTAHDVGTFTQTVTMKGQSAKESGKYVVLLKRQGGQWKVSHAIYNRDAARPAGPPATRTSTSK